MATEKFTELFEKHNIVIQARDNHGTDMVYITWYEGDEPAGNGEIEDYSGIAQHIEWLYTLIVDVENMLSYCNGWSDVNNFVEWLLEPGHPITLPAYEGEGERVGKQYEDSLRKGAKTWEYLHTAYKELVRIFGQDLYNAFVKAARED